MKNPILRALGWLTEKISPFPTQEYVDKFLKPKYERGIALGISDEDLHTLWKQAWEMVDDPTIPGGAPGSIFDRLIDDFVAKRDQHELS
jgi:hypothetical protein